MKNNILIFLPGVLFILLFACSGNKETNAGNNTTKVPEVLKNDTLLNIYEYQVIDTFENGYPMTIRFFDKSDLNNPLFEKKYYQNGHIFMQGPYKNNKRDGKWIAWYENGVIWSTGNYKNGLRNGQSISYYENGSLRYSKNYELNIAEGVGKFYTPDGTLAAEIMYSGDTIMWKKEYNNE
ncbi:MAG: hypothetical protein LBQ22_12430 [Bacteroidales bacterium]|jgi:antitoxin component YwqK of YwqJK toxin-antitoxin module|nr:hypothetical protein [Bacteroidales bacterium]